MASLTDPSTGTSPTTKVRPTQASAVTATGDGDPPPLPEMCTECVHPADGHHFFSTVSECQAIGGTLVGDPFPCPETEQGCQVLAKKMGLPLV
jgi:hypothetical protein